MYTLTNSYLFKLSLTIVRKILYKVYTGSWFKVRKLLTCNNVLNNYRHNNVIMH